MEWDCKLLGKKTRIYVEPNLLGLFIVTYSWSLKLVNSEFLKLRYLLGLFLHIERKHYNLLD